MPLFEEVVFVSWIIISSFYLSHLDTLKFCSPPEGEYKFFLIRRRSGTLSPIFILYGQITSRRLEKCNGKGRKAWLVLFELSPN